MSSPWRQLRADDLQRASCRRVWPAAGFPERNCSGMTMLSWLTAAHAEESAARQALEHQTTGMEKEMADLVYAQGGLQAQAQMWEGRYRDLQEQLGALQDAQTARLDAQDVLHANCKQLQTRCDRHEAAYDALMEEVGGLAHRFVKRIEAARTLQLHRVLSSSLADGPGTVETPHSLRHALHLLKWAEQGVERMCTAIVTLQDAETHAEAVSGIKTSRLGQLDQQNRTLQQTIADLRWQMARQMTEHKAARAPPPAEDSRGLRRYDSSFTLGAIADQMSASSREGRLAFDLRSIVQERDMLRHKLQEEVEQTRAYKAALQEAAAIIAQHDWQAVLRKPHP
ncbi:hypothetical protein WJX84_006696 [Apatococcus fuscideae]|uniref:Uncharacterized protein n=1 Tax=Apatococcus fuscideae TaxID=2026836 RepID=A0AAW1TBA5_9CHLO